MESHQPPFDASERLPFPTEMDTNLVAEMTHLFIEVAPDAVMVSDEHGHIIFVNQQMERSFGYSRAELLNMQVDALLPERFRGKHGRNRMGYYLTPHLRPMGLGLALFAARKDGSEFPVEISLSPLQTQEGLRVIGIIRDTTQRSQLEAQLQAARQEADRLKDEFIAIAAHELRNPLAALRGFTDMLQVQTARGHGPALAEWQVEAIEAIDQSSARLADLTDDLLDVTRLQAGKLMLHFAPHDIVALTRQVMLRQQATTQRHTLVLTPEQEPLMVPLDPLRFEQVLTNLLHNAIKYSPDGGTIQITIDHDAVAETVQLSVRDPGIGIPIAEQERVFTRFARAANARNIGGTGLGLYLCRALVERHHGTISFTSQEGQGSVFRIVLPCSADNEAAAVE
ncbi:MAG: PAS domain-containing sensor histidine kinase [Ktedonobacterales bacterium]|nr:PAS domain-containing sensor histidine kinase [Ktedonobacterales bacterium]